MFVMIKIVCQHSVTYQIVTGHLHTSMVIFNVGNPRVIHFDSLYHDLRKLIVCYNRPSLSSDLNHILSFFSFLFDEDSKNISTYVCILLF